MTPKTFAALGVRPLINAQGRLTRLGGSIMAPEVVAAMADASTSYVDIFELQREVGRRLAELTHNEAAYVCTGAATGLFLTTLACMTGTDSDVLAQLPRADLPKNEVVIHACHRFSYDPAVRLAGATFKEVGDAHETVPWQLEEAIGPRTAAVLYLAGEVNRRSALSLEQTIEIAHADGVPVIVDAAAQLPPAENLWRYTRDLGADLAIFSGGKDLRGPQSSGLIVGRRDLIDAVFVNGAPNPYIGRPMKVGKEEMAGLLAAVERYLSLDHAARLAGFEATVQGWIDAFTGIPGIHAERAWPNEAGQPMPRLLLTFDPDVLGFDANDVRHDLWEGEPRIAVGSYGEKHLYLTHAESDPGARGIYVTPDTLEPGDAEQITERLHAIIRARRRA